MYRPLPLCWQLKYSGSKAEKDTFTSIIVEALVSTQNNKVTHRTGNRIFSLNRLIVWHSFFLRHLSANAPSFVLHLHAILLSDLLFCHMMLCNKHNCVRFTFCFVGFMFVGCFQIFLFLFSFHYSPVKIKVIC